MSDFKERKILRVLMILFLSMLKNRELILFSFKNINYKVKIKKIYLTKIILRSLIEKLY